MSAGKHRSPIKWLLAATICSLILTGCGKTTAGPTQPANASNYSTQEQALVIDLSCPDEKTEFDLWLSHYEVLDIDEGDGETFYLKFENLDPVAFSFYMYPDGTVSNKEESINTAMIDYHGEARHPNSDDCPVQTFDGSWELKAIINGTCSNDIVRIQIKEEWVNPVLVSDCTGPIGPGIGLFSAPELDLTFRLKDEIPTDSLEIMAGGPFQARYTYYLWPFDAELLIDPLVPEDD